MSNKLTAKLPKGDSIKYWAEDDRPREKMLKRGNTALSDMELITILLQGGNGKKSAVDLAREIMTLGNNNLSQLGKLSVKDFQKIKGIGLAKSITLGAALELGRRRQLSEGILRKVVSSSKSAADILIPLMSDLVNERFCLLCLSASNALLHYEFVSSGGLSSTVVDVRVIMKTALQQMASKVIIAHNHPSGNLKPSSSDRAVTEKIKQAGSVLDIQLVDHIIIGDQQYLSFADEGLL